MFQLCRTFNSLINTTSNYLICFKNSKILLQMAMQYVKKREVNADVIFLKRIMCTSEWGRCRQKTSDNKRIQISMMVHFLKLKK